ncbi:helix-turn-helix domain-containing protein [Paenibacillus glucanolyticus]|uniref:helix-turn-helix domain-containing protein n=1 Tax=Paenibacillus glucanolyticus TaxID=59843 RepID=UPI0007B4FD8B|nr:helix-turn-helix transcriptional regulator [Paenibacillus glucanolyticus]
MKTLGDRIKYLREKKEITQKELATKTGLTVVQLSRYETNDRKPDPEALKQIADVLDTNGDYLLGRTNDSSPKITANKEDDEIEELLDDPVHGAFFKGYLDAPEQKKAEMRQFLKFILEQEKDRKPGQQQGE